MPSGAERDRHRGDVLVDVCFFHAFTIGYDSLSVYKIRATFPHICRSQAEWNFQRTHSELLTAQRRNF